MQSVEQAGIAVAGGYITVAANTKGVIDRLPHENLISAHGSHLQGLLLRTLFTTPGPATRRE